jgi:hypothetical protein
MTLESLVDHLRQRIGWQSDPTLHVVEAGSLRRWAEAIGDPDPRWREEAPPTYFASLRPDTWATAATEALSFGKQWLNGGDRYTYGRSAQVGETVRAQTRLADVSSKAGRSGDLLILQFETRFEAGNGEILCTIESTVIRR